MWKAEGQSQLWTGWFKLSEHVRCVTFVSQSVTVFLLSPVCVCHRWFLGLNRSSSKIGPVVVHLLNLTRYGLLSLYLSTPASDLRPAGLDELFDQITKKQSDSPSLFISFCLRFYPLFPTFLFIFFLFLLPLSLSSMPGIQTDTKTDRLSATCPFYHPFSTFVLLLWFFLPSPRHLQTGGSLCELPINKPACNSSPLQVYG